MFKLFKKKPKPQQATNNGLFGYYGLMNWYMNEFNEEDRVRFRMAYDNNDIPFERIISGNETPLMNNSKVRSAVYLLASILAKILAKGEYSIDVLEKMIDKIDKLITEDTDVLEQHFAYAGEIHFYKEQMKSSPRYEQGFIQACKKQIEIAERVREQLKAFHWNELSDHEGFRYLQEYYKKKGKWQEVYDLSNEAVKVWGSDGNGVDYKSWLDDLIKNNEIDEAKRVLALAFDGDAGDISWSEYQKRIDKIAVSFTHK